MRSPTRPGDPVEPARSKRTLRRAIIAVLAVVVVAVGAVAVGLDLGGVTATASSGKTKPHGISSSSGRTAASPTPSAITAERVRAVKRVVVVGDSTAAGLGNRPLAHPTASDRACGRSRDAFAVDLADARRWSVTNLACSGATIRSGLLGAQSTGKRTLPAQRHPARAARSRPTFTTSCSDSAPTTSTSSIGCAGFPRTRSC